MNPKLTTDDAAPPAVASDPMPASPLPFHERLSDRVNPIFLRELQQAFKCQGGARRAG